MCRNIDFSAAYTVSTRSFRKPPGAKPVDVSFRPGGARRSDAAGDVRWVATTAPGQGAKRQAPFDFGAISV